MARREGYESQKFIQAAPASAVPVDEISKLGPVARSSTHAAFVPWRSVAGAPGVGAANMAYVPDYLISAPNYFAGNATLRHANAMNPTGHATMVTGQPTILEGVGGLTAGQFVTGPLLGVENENDMDLGYYNNG